MYTLTVTVSSMEENTKVEVGRSGPVLEASSSAHL